MLIKRSDDIKSSEITPEKHYFNRRKFITAAATAAVGAVAMPALISKLASASPRNAGDDKTLPVKKGQYDTDEKMNSWEDITTYNNYYEFGTDKSDPSQNAGKFKTAPWSVVVEGEVKKPATYHLEDLLKPYTMEDRIYRHRCVEAWSMVIPWHGFPLRDLINRLQPTSKAKYVAFTTLYDPVQMPGQERPVLEWPYVEGLRMDEAMHPLTLMVTGLYGKALPNQDGAPS